jgi:hypothetical protein
MERVFDKLSAIGDAIRAKTESTDMLTLEDMPKKITSISGSGAILTVVSNPGASITVRNGSKSYTKVVGSEGNVVFNGLGNGTWTIVGTYDGVSSYSSVDVNVSYGADIKFVEYLFYNGIMYPPLSSGGINANVVDGKLEITKASANANSDYFYYTNDTIDLTGFNWLYVDINAITGTWFLGFHDPTNEDGYGYVRKGVAMDLLQSYPGVYKMSLNGINTWTSKLMFRCGYKSSGTVSLNGIWLSISDSYNAIELEQTDLMPSV